MQYLPVEFLLNASQLAIRRHVAFWTRKSPYREALGRKPSSREKGIYSMLRLIQCYYY